MSEEQLHITQLKEGSAPSFEHLYNLWSGKLYNFVMRISKEDRYLAEEIVQLAFVKIWENHESLNPNLSFAAYLCAIARNTLINIYQHRMTESLYREKILQTSSAEYTTEDDVNYHLLDEYINSLIEQLPPARKEIFLLSRKQYLSNKEIAAKLNLSENTIESQLTKATAFLRKKVALRYDIHL